MEFYDIVTAFIFAIGVFGNILSFLVFSRKNLTKTPASFYLKAISINNCMILLQELRRFIRSTFKLDFTNLSNLTCKIVIYMIYTTITVSIWIMVFILLDRFISIKFNQKFELQNKIKFKVLVLSTIYSINCCYYIPVFIDVKLIYNNDINTTLCFLDEYKGIIPVMDLIYSTLIPFFLMICLTSLLIFSIFRLKKRFASQMTKKEKSFLKKDFQFGFTSIFLNLIFLTTYLPITINNAFFQNNYSLILYTLDKLVYLYSAIPIFIYFLTIKIFRLEFLEMIGTKSKIHPRKNNVLKITVKTKTNSIIIQ